MNLYQDVTEIVDVDADVILVLFSEETIAVYGSSYSLYSAADAAAILSVVTDVAAMTAVSGSSFFSSSAADVVITHLAVTDVDVRTLVAAAMIAAVNKTNFKDGFSVLFTFSE